MQTHQEKSEYFVKSVEVNGHRCSHCGLMSFSSEDKTCPGCWNSFDTTDEIQYWEDGIIYTDKEKIEELTNYELWECDSCGSINSNKPKNYDGHQEIDCKWCGKNFDINNWKKPFCQFEELTFSEENDYEKEFIETYFKAFELARKNNDLENFYSKYKQLLKELVEEDIFERDDEVKNLYNYLLEYIKNHSFEEKAVETEEKVKRNLKDILPKVQINSSNTKKIWVATLIALWMYFGVTSDYEQIKINSHNWEVLTPKDVFKYKRFEIFNRHWSRDYKIYIERKKDPKLAVVDLWYGEMWNGIYHTENDWPKILRNVPGSCYWTYKYIPKQVDDHFRPIKETRTERKCHTKYRTITRTKEDCRTVRHWDKRERVCRTKTYRDRILDGQECKTITERVIVWYRKKTIKEKVRDEEICKKEWYQPTKQVENMEETIIYKAKQWQSDWYHISRWNWTNPHIIYSPKVDERIYENRSKTNYYLNYTIYSEDWAQNNRVQINNEYDWKSIKDWTECKVKVYKILWISLWANNDSILEKCK